MTSPKPEATELDGQFLADRERTQQAGLSGWIRKGLALFANRPMVFVPMYVTDSVESVRGYIRATGRGLTQAELDWVHGIGPDVTPEGPDLKVIRPQPKDQP